MKNKSASKASIEDFRDHVAQGLGPASGVLFNVIDALAVGPRPIFPVELTLSPLWGSRWSSLYTADGQPRDKRPLWLIFVPASDEIEPPTPQKAQAIYEERFSVEHSIRFMKGDLGLTCGQFNSVEAEGRVQVWVEIVATTYWFLWALRALAETEREKLLGWWLSGKLTPGAIRRLAAGLLLSLGWSKPELKTRGKSPGRAKETRFEPRERFKAYRSASR